MWFAYSLFFAFWTSIGMLLNKHLIKDFKPVSLIVVGQLFTLPFMIIILLFVLQIPHVNFEFFKIVFFTAIIDIIAAVAYFKAVSISPISLISPISSFNPVFVLLFAYLLLNETPTPIKILGILIIVLGSYLLNLKDAKSGLLNPLKNLFSDRGVLLFLLSNFIWGLTPILQKKAIFLTHPQVPLFPSFVETIFSATLLLLFILIKREKLSLSPIKKYSMLLIFIGIMNALSQFAAYTAFSLTNVSYVAAIFKLSTLFTVILGAVFFGEKRIKERFLGAAVMVLGTILLAF